MAIISGFKNRGAVSNNPGILNGGLKNRGVLGNYRGFRSSHPIPQY